MAIFQEKEFVNLLDSYLYKITGKRVPMAKKKASHAKSRKKTAPKGRAKAARKAVGKKKPAKKAAARSKKPLHSATKGTKGGRAHQKKSAAAKKSTATKR